MNIVRRTLHTTRENVNLIQEIIRQAFLLPLAPLQKSEVRRRDENAIEIVIRTFNWILWDAQMPIWCEEPKRDGSPEDIVRAGTQPALHCFILFSSNVFLTPKDIQISDEILESQESICLKVLNMYRHVIMKVDMNDITWNQLLIVLVHISKHILNTNEINGVSKMGHSTLAERIQAPLIQTLIVAWIKASLYAAVSMDLWDDLLDLLKDMTHLKDMITEWTKTMDVLSKMLIKQVYNLELESLPLEKPSATTRKRRGRTRKSSIETPINRSVSEAPSRAMAHMNPGLSMNKTISAPGEGGLMDSSSDSMSYTARSEVKDESNKEWNFASENRITRAMSTSDVTPNDSSTTSGDEIRNRTRSGGSLKDSSFSFFNNAGDQQDCQSDTTSIQQEWNPEITHQEDTGQNSDSAIGGLTMQNSHKDNISVSFSTKPYDTNTVIFENVTDDAQFDEDTTVMSGGRKTGWSMDVAFVLWRRIMGILGNINKIKDPELHGRVLSYLHRQWDYLYRVRDNLGISIDNQATPPLPLLVPPLHVFVPWCLESFQLNSSFQTGKLLSLELLCRIFIVSQYNNDYQMNYTSLSQFYQLIHECLLDGSDLPLMYKAIKTCQGGFFSSSPPGSFLLYEDFIFAIEQINHGAASNVLDDECPREEAQLTAISLIFLSKSLTKENVRN